MRLLPDIFAVHPRHRRAHGDSDRIRMERKIADRDEVVHRVDHRDRHTALGGRVDPGTGATIRETSSTHEQEEERRLICGSHGCLTTTTPFMNGCGVQWKEDSPGCVNV